MWPSPGDLTRLPKGSLRGQVGTPCLNQLLPPLLVCLPSTRHVWCVCVGVLPAGSQVDPKPRVPWGMCSEVSRAEEGHVGTHYVHM